jgi:Cdc6-like AAA superfamily ATPase/DNA-binding MarR family transcriptional regulator
MLIMMNSKNLVASQQFITRELLSYDDELFCLLYHDIGDFVAQQSPKILRQGRRISIYGVRGVGKTTAMQGVLWNALTSSKDTKILPITVTVMGARAASNMKELEDAFYRSVISGVLKVIEFKKKENRLREGTQKYAPWVGRKITEAFSIIFPPLALASDLAEKSIKWLVGRLKQTDIEAILTSTTIDAKQVAGILTSRLEEAGATPVFVIDELDKVSSDTLLSDFFDGNQSWFQGKRGMLSLTYTFGESIKETIVSSVRRLSTVEMYPGVITQRDAEKIIHSRAFLGISQLQKNEKVATETTQELFPPETIKTILNVSAPNTYIMLERTYEAIQRAIESRSKTVMPEHVLEEEKELDVPTELEQQILKQLSKGRLTPTDVAGQLDKASSSVVRSLRGMMSKNWVTRVGVGKRAYYSLTARGNAAIKRAEK